MADKVTKESVNYTPRAMKVNERCGKCEFFHDTRILYGECRKVKGSISPRGWCELFKKKGALTS